MNIRFKVFASYNILQYLCDFCSCFYICNCLKMLKTSQILTNIVILQPFMTIYYYLYGAPWITVVFLFAFLQADWTVSWPTDLMDVWCKHHEIIIITKVAESHSLIIYWFRGPQHGFANHYDYLIGWSINFMDELLCFTVVLLVHLLQNKIGLFDKLPTCMCDMKTWWSCPKLFSVIYWKYFWFSWMAIYMQLTLIIQWSYQFHGLRWWNVVLLVYPFTCRLDCLLSYYFIHEWCKDYEDITQSCKVVLNWWPINFKDNCMMI
jgi:hypothetical protein